MTRDEAQAIVQLPIDEAIDRILCLAEKAEKYEQLCGEVSPTTPSGMEAQRRDPLAVVFYHPESLLLPYYQEPGLPRGQRDPGGGF